MMACGIFTARKRKSPGYNNPQVDKLITEGNSVLDVEKRKPIYHQLYQVLAQDPPVILLGYREILSGEQRPGHRLQTGYLQRPDRQPAGCQNR
ncbi:oligopeptide ABC transporter [Klebsiella michiganensis]|uniref:Oligopeptide ABC transporter n=1 Tax=Klebsiella michiganensis TaxID=1134687 RepID=A0A7H4PLJ7_9ENTR|nr:oligopeptide ABC transporter [Klebsiella michiganensis]